GNSLNPPKEPVLGAWEHYAFEVDRTTGAVTVYQNGVKVAIGTITAPPAGGKWVLGHSEDLTNTDDNWNGLLDDVRIYNRLLTPREVGILASGTDSVIRSVLANDTDGNADPL